VRVEYPLFYETFLNFIENYKQYLPALLILWFFMVCFFNFIELYIFMKYYISTNDLYIPKLFSARPNIIKNWLTELYELSKSDYRKSFMLFCPLALVNFYFFFLYL